MMKIVAALLVGVCAAQMGQMGMPMGMPGMPGMGMPGMGMPGMGMGQMGGMGMGMPMGQPQMPQMPQMGGFPGMPMGQQQFPGMGGFGMPGFGAPGAPQGVPPAAAQAPLPAAAAPATDARAQAVEITDNGMQLKDMAKWAEMMGMPKMSDDDMGKIMDMQKQMLGKLKALPENDLSAMRTDQNALADEMQRVMSSPTQESIESFQGKQENLMSQWSQKLNLPQVTPQEHNMMRDQLKRMFETIQAMPPKELEALKAKHEEVKAMMVAHNNANNANTQ